MKNNIVQKIVYANGFFSKVEMFCSVELFTVIHGLLNSLSKKVLFFDQLNLGFFI